MCAYIRPVKCNVKILNGRKYPAKGFGLVITKIPNTNITIPLGPSYYMPQNPQKTISQTELKHYNEFRSVGTEALRWVKITTDIGMKLKLDKKNRIDQQLLDFITIDVLKIEQLHPSSKDIITIPITPVINSYSKKHLMSWELIHCLLLHPSESFMKVMCRNKTLYGLPK